MRDYLLDIVKHINGLGGVDYIKVVGDENTTSIHGFDKETKTVILDVEFKTPIADFVGTFGMPNLDRLNNILNIPVYAEDAKITIAKQADDQGNLLPSGVNFEGKDGDFKNTYRFMTTTVINDLLPKKAIMKPVPWHVEIQPTAAAIQKLRFQSSVHSDSTAFSTTTKNGNLEISFGDHSSHAGSFVFAAGVSGSLTRAQQWPVGVINTILSLSGDKIMRISNDGVMEITVDSGLAVYHYKMPAQTK
jgi:hypothetical protein